MSEGMPPYLPDQSLPLRLIPPQASTGAYHVDMLGLALLVMCVVLTLAVAVLMAYFCFRYRAGAGFRRQPLLSERKIVWYEIGWALGLFALFMVFFFWGAAIYVNLYRAPDDALTIHVVGKQWMWKFEHPSGAREINTLHVPAHRKVRLEIRTQDVIHSLYIPAFRIKHDAVPNMTNMLWFEATQTGVYRLFCAEYCGTSHSRMRGRVIVMEPAEYSDWLVANGHEQGPVVDGKQLFMTYGCSGCHMGKSAVKAPKLAGIYGRAVPLSNGTTKIADEAYIRDSILRPEKDIVAGYRPIMPSFADRISEGDLQKIIAYIRSLEPGDWIAEDTGAEQ